MIKKNLFTIANIVTNFLAFLLRIARRITSPLKRFWRLSLLKSQCNFPVPVTTQLDGNVSVLGTARLKLGEYCRISSGVVFETHGDGEIIIGNHVRINQGTHIVAYEKLTIGDNCLIGEYCSIRDANHGIAPHQLIRLQAHSFRPIIIEEDCWIARGATILKGTILRKGAVIGANAIINKEIGAGDIMVSPAGTYLKNRL